MPEVTDDILCANCGHAFKYHMGFHDSGLGGDGSWVDTGCELCNFIDSCDGFEPEDNFIMDEQPKYPEHEKLRAVHDQTLLLSEFYDWLESNGYHIARFHEHAHACYEESGSDGEGRPDADGLRWHSGKLLCGLLDGRLYNFGVPPPDKLFGLFFNIDPKKLSAEKDAMYEELRAANKRQPAGA